MAKKAKISLVDFPPLSHNDSKDYEALTVQDPGYVGSVMLTCEDPSLTVNDIVREFEIEQLDNYMERARKVRRDSM